MKALVPVNHRPIEHALAEVLAPIAAINPAAIEQAWNAWAAPSPLLPFLGYALSVDFWEDGWDDVRKRQAIADSPVHHRRKGTRAAVEAAAAFAQRRVLVSEWWQGAPPRRRGTFHVTVVLGEDDAGLSVGDLALMRRLIERSKPKSRAFTLAESRYFGPAVTAAMAVSTRASIRLRVNPDDIGIRSRAHVYVYSPIRIRLEAA